MDEQLDEQLLLPFTRPVSALDSHTSTRQKERGERLERLLCRRAPDQGVLQLRNSGLWL